MTRKKKWFFKEKTSFSLKSKKSSLFRTKDIFLIVLFHFNILILNRFNMIVKLLFFRIHSHVIVPKRTLEINRTACCISWLVMPSIISRRNSCLFCTWLKDLFPKCLIHSHFHWTIKRFDISQSPLIMIYCFILSQRRHEMKHSWIILSWNIPKKWYIPI